MDHADRFKKYIENAYRFLSIRNRSEKEIRDYLVKKKATPEIIEQIITLLTEQKFLDDEVFAKGWIAARARFRPKGKALLKFELQQKGIAKEIIEKVLDEARVDLPDELTQAKQLIQKRIEKMKDKSRQEIYNKVGAFLARRGFNWDTIKKAIDGSLKSND